jgi:hypothetical protein
MRSRPRQTVLSQNGGASRPQPSGLPLCFSLRRLGAKARVCGLSNDEVVRGSMASARMQDVRLSAMNIRSAVQCKAEVFKLHGVSC